jgi:molecular chaperone GrpE
MANESTENKSAEEIAADALAAEIIEHAEEQVEVQLAAAAENISVEQEKINELELALATAKSTVADQKDSVIRAKAEVDNVRRRAAQDVEKARKFALEKFAAEMLTTVDNLERALQSIDKDDERNTAIIEGVELTYQG